MRAAPPYPSKPRRSFTVACGSCRAGRVSVPKRETRLVDGKRLAFATRALCGDCCRAGKRLEG